MIRIVRAIYFSNGTLFGFGPAAIAICKYLTFYLTLFPSTFLEYKLATEI